MVLLRGFEVAIVVNGEDLAEYAEEEYRDDDHSSAGEGSDDDDQLASHRIERYVEAKTADTFHFRFQERGTRLKSTLSAYAGITVNVVLDGTPVSDSTIYRTWPYTGTFEVRKYRRAGISYQQPFKFGEVKLSDDMNLDRKSQEVLKVKASNLGTVELMIRRATSYGNSYTSNADYGSHAAADQSSIHEKFLKGQAQSLIGRMCPIECIGELSLIRQAAETARNRKISHGVYIDTLKKPYLHFEFHYMSRASLQIMGLIPRSPSPEEAEDAPAIALQDMTREQLLQLANRQRETIRNHTVMKRESTTGPRVKRERPIQDDEELSFTSARCVRAKKSAAITIDLTDD